MKVKRQRKIMELVEKYDIDTQEELAKLLTQSGFTVTQATVSRDIKELKLMKTTSDTGSQKYILPDKVAYIAEEKYMRVLSDAVVSIDFAGNIVVIKTASGMAMAVAAAVDALKLEDIIGCIAGDDTIMCIIKDANRAEDVKQYFEELQ